MYLPLRPDHQALSIRSFELLGCEAMKKSTRRPQTKLGPIILFLIFCIVGEIIGIAINNRYYAAQRGELNGAAKEMR